MCKIVHLLSEQMNDLACTSVHQISTQDITPSPWSPPCLPEIRSGAPPPSSLSCCPHPCSRSVSPAGLRAPLGPDTRCRAWPIAGAQCTVAELHVTSSAISQSCGLRGTPSLSGVPSPPREMALWGPIVKGPTPVLRKGHRVEI